MRRRITAAATAVVLLVSGLSLAACQPVQEDKHRAPKHSAPKSTKKVEPAPNPDPAKPNPSFPGNVEIVFTVSHSEQKVVYVYNIGAGPQRGSSEHKHGGETSFSRIVKPEQVILFAAAHSSAPQGWLSIQVYQRNNGRIVCKDNNDEDPVGNVACSGIVKI